MQGRGCASAAAAASPAGACVAPAGGGAAPAAAVGGALPAAAGSGVAAGAGVGLVPSAASGSMASSSPAAPPTYTPCEQPSQAGITTGSNYTAGRASHHAHPLLFCASWRAAPAQHALHMLSRCTMPPALPLLTHPCCFPSVPYGTPAALATQHPVSLPRPCQPAVCAALTPGK